LVKTKCFLGYHREKPLIYSPTDTGILVNSLFQVGLYKVQNKKG
jgi:hypothetical protein